MNSISFESYGNRIVTASSDNTAAIFACGLCRPLEELLDLARQELAPAVTPEEQAAYLSESGVEG